MKLKIYYNGNPAQTQVVDQETGEIVEGVVSAHVDIDAFNGYATLVLADFEADISNIEVKQDENPAGVHGAGDSGDNREDFQQASGDV